MSKLDLEYELKKNSELSPSLISKKEYFFDRFKNKIEILLQDSKQMGEFPILETAWQATLKVAAGLLAGKLIGDVFGEKVKGGIWVGGLLGLWLAGKGVKEAQQVTRSAKKICNLLGVLEIEGNYQDSLIKVLFFEFHLSIELLEISHKGIDRLVDYFILSILEYGNSNTEGYLKKLNRQELQVHLISYIHEPENGNFKKIRTSLDTDHNLKNWNLAELLFSSPVFLIEGIAVEQKIIGYKFTAHLRQGTKNRNGMTVSAEGSHKYPARFLDHMYRHCLKKYNYDSSNALPVITNPGIVDRTLTFSSLSNLKNYSQALHELYKKLISVRQTRENPLSFFTSKEINSLLDSYLNISEDILQLQYAFPSNFIYFFASLHNLRNAFWQEIKPLRIKGDSLKFSKAEEQFSKMTNNNQKTTHVGDGKIQQIEKLSLNEADLLKYKNQEQKIASLQHEKIRLIQKGGDFRAETPTEKILRLKKIYRYRILASQDNKDQSKSPTFGKNTDQVLPKGYGGY